MDYGPFLTTTVGLPWPAPSRVEGPKTAVTPKGVVAKLGDGAVCFDTDLLRCVAGWTGGFLTLMGPSFDGVRSPDEKTRPVPKGALRFATRNGPGWSRGGNFKDPRPEPYGPLPADWAKWKGLYVHGDRVIFSYTVGRCPILEMPGLDSLQGVWAFSRTFRVGPSAESLTLLVCEGEGVAAGIGGVSQEKFSDREGLARVTIALLGDVAAGLASPGGGGTVDVPAETAWEIAAGPRLYLKLPPRASPTVFKLVVGSGRVEDRAAFARFLREDIEDPEAFTRGGPARYPQEVVTRGVLGRAGGAYEVDTLTAPEENPWHSWIRFGGLDFFSDGRAALCTWSGDVWIVSGIDEKLEKLHWRRYATGLFQPCGVKIVEDTLYVLGRDQITRFHDLNGDGEADYYENFNNDCADKGNYHEFAMDLNTDAEGNFYYAKGALGANFPGGPVARHHGCMLKVSKDGRTLEVVATGIRAGAGSGVGPKGEITVSDNDGHWGPASRLNIVRKGGYYGDPHTAHSTPVPKDFDPPLCWIHRAVDNSSGGQLWVTSDRWGPFKGRLLHLSYGTCSLFHVFMETVDGQVQGGLVRFPLTFASGLLRGRFHPKDGQLYLAGLKGWSSSASRDGCFHRVRYTGKPVHTLAELHVTRTGIDLVFTGPVDPETAADLDSYAVQWWNYAYTEKYGSPDFSVSDPKKQGRDTVEIKSAKVSSDGRKVSLEIPGIRPVNQMLIRLRIRAADGSPISLEIYNTINRVP